MILSPSLLSADFSRLADELAALEAAGISWLHLDIMDGAFVPNITFGQPVIKSLRKRSSKLFFDVHLMIDNPLDELPWFLEAGADIACVHAEVLYGDELRRAVDMIHDAGAKAAVALKPHTPPEVLEEVIARLDMVLVMSVEPGFSGQSYIEGSEEKVAAVAEMARAVGNDALLIEVDGGVSEATVERLTAAGADVLVCGSAVFGAQDPAAALAAVKEKGDAARVAAIEDARAEEALAEEEM